MVNIKLHKKAILFEQLHYDSFLYITIIAETPLLGIFSPTP